MKTKEQILDKYYTPKMHWKSFNREQVLKAMDEYCNQKNQAALMLLKEIKDFHEGNGKYNFSNLNDNDRGNASFDAWQLIFNKILLMLK